MGEHVSTVGGEASFLQQSAETYLFGEFDDVIRAEVKALTRKQVAQWFDQGIDPVDLVMALAEKVARPARGTDGT